MQNNFLFYDLETTGINHSQDRITQFAAIRTDENFNIIEEPINIFCRLPLDALQSVEAALITNTNPEFLKENGLDEFDFMQIIHQEFMRANTCILGYNSLRFDDEILRYAFYRNLYEPYEREWKNGNSRFDLIDLVRATFALRPENINWVYDENNLAIMKLELLSKANNLNQENAHDALSDIYATIDLAKLIKDKQPKLFDFYFKNKHKKEVSKLLDARTPLIHISGSFSAKRNYIAPILPLCIHPHRTNVVLALDLSFDPKQLLELDSETIKEILYTKHSALAERNIEPLLIKEIKINQCPFLAPFSVIREEDKERLNWQTDRYLANAKTVLENKDLWQHKIKEIFVDREYATTDVESELYNAFINNNDKYLLDNLHKIEDKEKILNFANDFTDKRLIELFERYKLKTCFDFLSNNDKTKYKQFCLRRIKGELPGSANTIDSINASWQELLTNEKDTIKKMQMQVVKKKYDKYLKELIEFLEN